MLSNKPYLIRAFYDWIVDSECTPFLLVDATVPHCKVPEQFVEDGRIILNISPQAIRDLSVNARCVEFRASFSGVVYLVSVPLNGVLGIYARENQQGMFFEAGDDDSESAGTGAASLEPVEWTEERSDRDSTGQSALNKREVSHLRLVD